MSKQTKNWNRFLANQLKLNNISKNELAERSGVHLSTVYAICGEGKKGIHVDTLEKLLAGMDMELCVRRKND